MRQSPSEFRAVYGVSQQGPRFCPSKLMENSLEGTTAAFQMCAYTDIHTGTSVFSLGSVTWEGLCLVPGRVLEELRRRQGPQESELGHRDHSSTFFLASCLVQYRSRGHSLIRDLKQLSSSYSFATYCQIIELPNFYFSPLICKASIEST